VVVERLQGTIFLLLSSELSDLQCKMSNPLAAQTYDIYAEMEDLQLGIYNLNFRPGGLTEARVEHLSGHLDWRIAK
jgi:hypothetical protein